ncbi:restriction endonuclease subunit S [Lactobacillus amylovorus]|uniref:restriction endonuclease subunit S n=1 Tax=Lactobacillus amylovorus TaxID=1604 RepID=UPI0022E6C458|nr:restriction endonuclease subunit S [Lactobacillus amylovorus]
MALLLFTFFVWEQRKLKKLGFFYKGKGYTKKDLINNGVPILLYGELYTHYSEKISNTRLHSKLFLHSIFSAGNEVVLPDSGETSTDIARASWISNSGIILAGGLIIIKPNEYIFPGFLAYSLTYGKNHKLLASRAQGKSIVHIHANDLKTLNIIYPENLKEQQRIFALLEKLNKYIALQQRKLKLLRTLKSGLSFKLFNKKHLNNLSQISLDQIGQTYSGLTGKSKKDFGHGHAFYVSYLNVNQNEIGNPKQIDRIEIDKKQNLVQKNDIFFTISSETPEEVGLTSLWPVSCKNLYLNSFCFGFRINTKMFIPLYLGYLFRSEYFREKVLPLAQGISRYNLSKNNVLKIKIGQEEIAIQEKYAKVMNDLDSDILRQKKKVKELKLCKKFLLQNMFI